ncbi:MAG: hypothetical protein A3K03_02310 [Bdellovibrionales bacterium RIFOXYD1_FULL_44_7]|nr:MAG: hypothetical protein A3K03_02310 [Bdellovibrionales bacterium RIFOXYD1_FULL_44_7]
MELHGDRCFADDQAMLTGVATWPPATPQIQDKEKSCESNDLDKGKTPIMIIGQQKGRSSKQKMERNFGMSRPEGYRKAMRMMLMAERAKMPVLTFIDTPGAFPGADAEQRGQAQAIAESINLMAGLKVPTMAVVIGEGGSGGALAIGIGNKVLMQEYSFYSVISPESCASILWSDSSLAERASEKLRMWPQELLRFGTIDDIIPEPKGGAHRNWEQAALLLRENLIKHLSPLIGKGAQSIVKNRLTKFRSMGIKALETTKPAESNQ